MFIAMIQLRNVFISHVFSSCSEGSGTSGGSVASTPDVSEDEDQSYEENPPTDLVVFITYL